MAHVLLVTGGTRSGKSTYALERAEEAGTSRLFVATCPSVDHEMSNRVERHQQERAGRGWDTAEEEIAIDRIVAQKGSGYQVILIDCLTLWINNLLYRADLAGKMDDLDDNDMRPLCRQLLDACRSISGTVVMVTNEVGLGIVPDNALARKYRDLVGTCNQLIAREADEVVLVSCGLPLSLKK